jgi:hypothetical protein
MGGQEAIKVQYSGNAAHFRGSFMLLDIEPLYE